MRMARDPLVDANTVTDARVAGVRVDEGGRGRLQHNAIVRNEINVCSPTPLALTPTPTPWSCPPPRPPPLPLGPEGGVIAPRAARRPVLCWLHGQQANLDLPHKRQGEPVPRGVSKVPPMLRLANPFVAFVLHDPL